MLSLIAGVLLVWFPSVSLKVISYVIAGAMLLFGIILVTDYKARIFYTEFITLGVLFIILGSVLLLHNNIVIPSTTISKKNNNNGITFLI